MFIPKKIKKGVILKVVDSDGRKRYDFQYKDKYGYTNTIGGISRPVSYTPLDVYKRKV